jgi:hypothetical protein
MDVLAVQIMVSSLFLLAILFLFGLEERNSGKGE